MTELPLFGAHTRRLGRLAWLAGAFGVVTGVLCLVWPGHSILVVTLLVAAALLVGGISSLATGLRMRGAHGSGSLFGWGVLAILFAALIAWHPGMSTAVLVAVTGLAVLSGGLLLVWIAAAVRVVGGRWAALPGIGGLLAVVLGLYLLFAPHRAANLLGVLLGVLALLVGLALFVLGTKLDRLATQPPTTARGAAAVDPNTVVVEGSVVEPPTTRTTRNPPDGPTTAGPGPSAV